MLVHRAKQMWSTVQTAKHSTRFVTVLQRSAVYFLSEVNAFGWDGVEAPCVQMEYLPFAFEELKPKLFFWLS